MPRALMRVFSLLCASFMRAKAGTTLDINAVFFLAATFSLQSMWLPFNWMAGNVSVYAEFRGAMLVAPGYNSHLIGENIIVHCSCRAHTVAAASMKGIGFYGIANYQHHLPMPRARRTNFSCDLGYCSLAQRDAMQTHLLQLFRPAYIDQFFEASNHVVNVKEVATVPLIFRRSLCSQVIIHFLTEVVFHNSNIFLFTPGTSDGSMIGLGSY